MFKGSLRRKLLTIVRCDHYPPTPASTFVLNVHSQLSWEVFMAPLCELAFSHYRMLVLSHTMLAGRSRSLGLVCWDEPQYGTQERECLLSPPLSFTNV